MLLRKMERHKESERMEWPLAMSKFAPICMYLLISLVSFIPLGVPFPFTSNSSTYPEKKNSKICVDKEQMIIKVECL
jgi:hypothetical protein